MSIMTFGSTEGEPRECHVVHIGIQLKHGGNCELPVLTVPLICDDLEATTVQLCMSHLNQFDVADMAMMAQSTEVSSPDVLIGSDCYWQLVTGKVVRGDSGPVALQTRLGWVLIGPVEQSEQSTSLVTFTLMTTSGSSTKELERQTF